MRIILVRHGETEENKKGIIQGHLHGTLSSRGIGQAKKVAERLRKENLDLIISSDLARAYDTALEISKFHKETPLEKNELLRERFLGELQGKTKEDLGVPKDILIADYITTEHGESEEEFLKRAKRLIGFIKTREEKNILLVSHNGILKKVLREILNKGFEEMKKIKLENASITIFDFDGENFELILLNDTEHLK